MTPFSARALDRGLAGALVGLARHAEPKLTPPAGAEHLAEVRAGLESRLLESFSERVGRQPFPGDAEGAAPLLREMLDTEFESEHHRKFRANRSLRDVEPEVDLYIREPTGRDVEP